MRWAFLPQQRLSTEVWSGNHHCQTKNKATEPCFRAAFLRPPRASGRPQWAVYTICSPENWKDRRIFTEQAAHAEANSGDTGRETAVRYLRSGSCHYWKENKGTNAPAALLQFTLPPPISAALLAVSGCKAQHEDFMDSKAHHPPHSPMGVVPWDT